MRRPSVLATAVFALVITLGACASTSASGAGSTTSSAPVAGSIDATTAPFIGSKKSKRYYPTACQTVQLIKVEERVGFGSMKDAEAAGFTKDVYSTDCRY